MRESGEHNVVITNCGLPGASRILILCLIHASYAVAEEGGHDRVRHLPFAHLTTKDGLSQNNVVDILQDGRGFMWFATGDGLNRYDGNTFVVYKNNPKDPGSISDNFVRDLHEDDQGHLWVAAYPGVNKFDPRTERSTRYVHDPNNRNTISGDSVESIARDSAGYLWFGTSENGLDRFDPATETFTHYRNDSHGQFVGRITHVIEDSRREIWFVGERGLFHVNSQTGRITRRPASINRLSADYVCEDKAGNFWMLAWSPVVGVVKYDRLSGHLTKYPLPAGATGLPSSKLLDDGENGFWVPSSQGLYYFDRRTERLTRLFEHDETDPNSLNDNTVVSIYRDRAGLLWVATANGGLNILNLHQTQFGHYRHRPADRNSLSPGRVTAIHQEPNGVLWIGFYPRALDRLDRKTGRITHYVPGSNSKNGLSKGGDINSIYKDSRGYLWLGGWAGGLDRFDERTREFKHYGHDPHNPNSLLSDSVLSIYEDRSRRLWVGQFGGFGSYDPATDRFTNYSPNPDDVARLAYSVSAVYQDRSGSLWFGMLSGMLSRFDYRTKTSVTYTPDLHDPRKLQGGSIGGIREDRTGTLWLASGRGLYRYNRQDETFARYTEGDGLPSNDVMGIIEDGAGRLWLSTKGGLSRFDPKTAGFRNYDVSDGLLSKEFSRSCFQQGENGEMLFCGSSGVTTFFPENVRDDPYVPPVLITSFKIFNDPVPIGATSILRKAIPYVDSLTIPYQDNVFSFEFAALSYADPRKNRYRYKLENFDRGWNEVGSKQRLATYTNLNPGRYVFRVQGSNSDGIWNDEGVSLPILITPPWYKTKSFLSLCAAVFLTLLWVAYTLRIRQIQHEFKKLRDVIDTIPAMAWTARPDGTGMFVNKRWAEYTGLVPDEDGSGWTNAVHTEDRKLSLETWRAALVSGEPFEYELRFRRAADGKHRWFLARGVPHRDKHGKLLGWYGIFTDIEDRKRAEEDRRQIEADLAHMNRVNMMGELAASIAHEVNQPLTGIVSNGSACLRWLAKDSPDVGEVREAVRDIVRDGKRAGDVIARIRALTKRTAPPREALGLNQTIQEVLLLVGDVAKKHGITIRTSFSDDLFPVLGDRVQLQQVMLNLMMNAIEAMSGVPDRPRELIISTRNIDADQVQVSVADSGPGFDAATASRIFDPFYTSKPDGMGMGLSISRSIVQNHGGQLWARAEEGRGTVFYFSVPKYQGEESNAGTAAI